MDIRASGISMSTVDGLFGPFDAFDNRLAWVAIFLNWLLQAAFVKKPLELSWARAIIYALLINALVYGAMGVFCLQFPRFTWRYGDNPTLFALKNLTLFGLGNVLLLSLVWWRAPKTPPSFLTMIGALAASQLVWLPLSFALLSAPDHPFPGLERSDGYHHWRILASRLQDKPIVVGEFSTPEEFVSMLDLPPEIARAPTYPRFATKDVRPVSLRVNTALSNFKPGKGIGFEWLVQVPYAPWRWSRVAYINRATGEVRFMSREMIDSFR